MQCQSDQAYTVTTTKEGNGQRAKQHQEVLITFKMAYTTGEDICQSQYPMRVVPGRGDTLPELQEALKSMSVGEEATLKIKSSAIKNPMFQKGKDVIVNVQLKSLGREVAPSEWMNLSQREQYASQAKDKGNSFIKEKQSDNAVKQYLRGLAIVEFQTSDKAQQLKCSFWSNLSQAYLNLKVPEYIIRQFDKAIEYCNKVLTDDPNNVKILYRRAASKKGKGEYDEALADTKLALQIDSNSKQVQVLAEDIKKEKALAHEKRKKFYEKMISSQDKK